MSINGAVYQPTTVTYESEHEHQPPARRSQRPISYIAAAVSEVARRPCGISCIPLTSILPVVYLTSAMAAFVIGLTMQIHGVVGYMDAQPTASTAFSTTVAVIGLVLFCLSFLLLGLFLRVTRRACFRPSKDHLDGGGAQVLTVNPSTDLLVAAQYAPVSEVTYQPPNEESEQSKLMPLENKEITEETDRMLETDPRIVLRPLHQQSAQEEA